MASSSAVKKLRKPPKATLSEALGVNRRSSPPPPVEAKPSTPQPPGRVGKKAIVGFFPLEVSKQMKQIAIDENSSIQDLMTEALNDLFVKRGKPPIA
jgi:hypothetical protein